MVLVPRIAAIACMLFAMVPALAAITPVEANGRLQVKGTHLVNQRGEAIQLRGMATHGLQWFGKFYGEGLALEAAADQWGMDVIRLTLYLSEDGYLTSKTITKAEFEAMLDKYIQVCVRKGVYVIIDWHTHKPGYPGYYLKEAKTFFAAMAAKYASLPNVLWEICNEPSSASLTEAQSGQAGVSDSGHYVTWSEITAYANEVVPLIKAHNPDAVILVGTPSWSSLGISSRGNNAWKEIAQNKLAFSNILYVIHYYAAAHGFQAAIEAASQELPLFSTEWAASGFADTMAVNEAKGRAYVEMLGRRKISWCYWNYSDGPGHFSAFDTATTDQGPFAPSGANVTATGRLVYKWISEPADSWKDYATGVIADRSRRWTRKSGGLSFDRPSGRITVSLGNGTEVTVFRSLDGKSVGGAGARP